MTSAETLPGDPAAKPRKPLRRRIASTYRTLSPFAAPYRAWFVKGAIAAAVVVVARLAFPWPLRGVMELTLHEGGGRGGTAISVVPDSGDPVMWLVIAFLIVVAVWAAGEYVQRLAFAHFAKGTVRDARTAALERVSAGAARGREPSDVMSRVVGDSARLKSGLRGALIGITRNGVFFVAVTAIITILSWPIGSVFFAGGIIAFGIAGYGAVRVERVSRRMRKKEGALIDQVQRALDRREPSGGSSRGEVQSQLARIDGQIAVAIHAVLALSTCGVLVLAVHEARAGNVSPGDVFTILVYVLFMHNKLVGLGRQMTRTGRVFASAERLAKLVGAKAEPSPPRPLSRA